VWIDYRYLLPENWEMIESEIAHRMAPSAEKKERISRKSDKYLNSSPSVDNIGSAATDEGINLSLPPRTSVSLILRLPETSIVIKNLPKMYELMHRNVYFPGGILLNAKNVVNRAESALPIPDNVIGNQTRIAPVEGSHNTDPPANEVTIVGVPGETPGSNEVTIVGVPVGGNGLEESGTSFADARRTPHNAAAGEGSETKTTVAQEILLLQCARGAAQSVLAARYQASVAAKLLTSFLLFLLPLMAPAIFGKEGAIGFDSIVYQSFAKSDQTPTSAKYALTQAMTESAMRKAFLLPLIFVVCDFLELILLQKF
jgi:hypothetical protein